VKGSKIFKSDSYGTTSVRIHLDTKYGCLVGILDMLKGFLPSLFFVLWQPDSPYYLIAATLATIGHNYPLYYRFKGGRGLATIYGGFIVFDWVGVLVTSTGGILLSGLLGQAIFMRYAGLLLMIPWVWFQTQDVFKLTYVLVANALFWYAILPELRQVLRLRKDRERPDEQKIAELMGMGIVYRLVKRLRLANLIDKKKKDNES
jgi:glycerol-3-phosphate acyltransferase PlsY